MCVICAGYEMNGEWKERMTRVRRESQSRGVFRNEERLMCLIYDFLNTSMILNWLMHTVSRVKLINPSVVDGVER